MITSETIETWVKQKIKDTSKRSLTGLTAKRQIEWALEVFRLLSPALEEADNETIEEIMDRMREQ
jgi:hypothetical protein